MTLLGGDLGDGERRWSRPAPTSRPIGRLLQAEGNLAGTRVHMERAVTMSAAALGPEHFSMGLLRADLASLLQAQGDLTGARIQLDRCGSAPRFETA